MFGLSSFLALIGIVLVTIGAILLLQQKHKTIAAVSLITGIFLIFVPVSLIFILAD
jgi:glucose uptake protein GlcU